MKFRVLNLILLSAVILLSGCASRDLIKRDRAEVDAYIAQNPELSSLDRTCLQQGRFEIGITAETLRFMLGEPNSIETVQRPWASQEYWRYRRGGQKVFIIEDNHVVGITE
ncbi:hypothetical protein QA601_10875 [Chitinispirillales bacterium ANBcel5]|uniref:hypothetical protein n=1 Tax=Cellulosispirillum alkaliphilum TaxID=3039283 RepID=UPI002A55D4A9|nr:hypothetical protein [Chitinispirillales bacterium ANBcel5]